MRHCNEGQLQFSFPDNWEIYKYDEWSFYRNQFQKIKGGGVKAVDFIALAPNKAIWLIEVKDYRLNIRTKPSDLPMEIAEKVFDTLAGIFPARINATDSIEKDAADRVLQCTRIHVVVHLEQPGKQSKLHPRPIDPAHIKQKLKQLLKPIDPHPKVSGIAFPIQGVWEVTRLESMG